VLVGDGIVLWQFRIVQSEAEQLNVYDEEFATILRVYSDLLKFRDTLESVANEKNAQRRASKDKVDICSENFLD
jgi:hypothetical protein